MNDSCGGVFQQWTDQNMTSWSFHLSKRGFRSDIHLIRNPSKNEPLYFSAYATQNHEASDGHNGERCGGDDYNNLYTIQLHSSLT